MSTAHNFPKRLFGPPRFIEPFAGTKIPDAVKPYELKVGNISAPTKIPPLLLKLPVGC
uniref:Uncharacterized protein n=1 Tax=viral metagenome TaxID=1070528 RepID=A0A6C0D6F9_9ZZZZ